MEKNEQKLDDIMNEGTLIGEVWYKPQRAVILSCILAFLLILTGNILAICLAIFTLAISLFVNHAVKDYKTVDVYDSYLIVYSSEDGMARKILFDDIEEWVCKNGTNAADALKVDLKDGEVIYKNTFQIGKLLRYMNKALPDKEAKKVQEEKNKDKKLKFSWPFKKKK